MTIYSVQIFYIIAISWAAWEIHVSSRNEKKIRNYPGSMEHGHGIYASLSVLYPLTLIAAPLESYLRGSRAVAVFILFFFLSKLLKLWVIRTLRGNWVVKVYVWKDQEIFKDGPYRYFRHPNYMIMAVEISTYCLAGHAWLTAIVITPFYILLLIRRVLLENNLHYRGEGK